ncbi:hypothetical protein QZH41_019543 [Actinostola sp. cb2023]|nr:hypothetical protein QZH41_019543 [Actinostola sp. cb2023]
METKMADSVRLEQTPKRPVGGGINAGRLHRGHGKTAASASIPSKYQTIVTDNSEKKGFLSRSKRFYSGIGGYNPGPGQYGHMSKTETESTSYSKKGTGGFASKCKRFPRKQIQGESGPGPGEYEAFAPSENYFNKSGVTSTFHLPIAIKREDKKNVLPAPNQYNIGKYTGKVVHDNNVSAYAAFKSRSKREINNPNLTKGPSPCRYNINDKLVSDSPKTVSAPFKSTVERKMMQSPLPIPGPGSYDPSSGDESTANKRLQRGFLNKHYLCISAPALPLPLPDPTPGPGHYNIVDYEGPPKHFMSSSVFVSSTSRWMTGSGQIVAIDDDDPGPGRLN